MAVGNFTVYRIEVAFDVRRQLFVSQVSQSGRGQIRAQRLSRRARTLLIAKLPAAHIATGQVIVRVNQFRWRERALAILFDELLGEMSVHISVSQFASGNFERASL